MTPPYVSFAFIGQTSHGYLRDHCFGFSTACETDLSEAGLTAIPTPFTNTMFVELHFLEVPFEMRSAKESRGSIMAVAPPHTS